jgi:hypothetical protein
VVMDVTVLTDLKLHDANFFNVHKTLCDGTKFTRVLNIVKI